MPRPIRAAFRPAHSHIICASRTRPRRWRENLGGHQANAYGHGLERAARALDAADGFAVLDFQEAARLRVAGVTQPILMLKACPANERAAAAPIHAHAGDPQRRPGGDAARADLPGAIDVYLKVNSGMGTGSALPPRRSRRLQGAARASAREDTGL